MFQDQIKNQANRLAALLELERRPVGVTLMDDQEQFDSCTAKPVKYRIPYCVAVKSATEGHRLKTASPNQGCMGSARALGFIPLTEEFLSGKRSFDMGLYQSMEAAKTAGSHVATKKTSTYGACISALHLCEEEPDVVIIVTNPFNAMRIVQGANFGKGEGIPANLAGNQAVCAELTAAPLATGRPSVSLLCSGTRHICGWKPDEMGVAIPYELLDSVLDGLQETVNPLERDPRKRVIEQRFQDLYDHKIQIEYGRNYDTGLYRFGKSGVR